MKFKSRKDPFFISVFLITEGILAFIMYTILSKENLNREDYIPLIIVFLVGILITTTTFFTYYVLTPKQLKYRCGFIYGSINIKDIYTIVKNKTMWVGLKPATARNGLIIKYHKYNEIYISPKTNDAFIKELLKHNPTIKIE